MVASPPDSRTIPLAPTLTPNRGAIAQIPVLGSAPPPKQPNVSEGDNRYVDFYRVKIGESIFDSSAGQILVGEHPPYVWLSTRRHNEARFVLNDPDEKLFGAIAVDSSVEVELGFVGGKRQNKFIGKIFKIGRVPPNGTIVIAVDPAHQLQQQAGGGAVFTGETPVEGSDRVASGFTTGEGKVVQTLTGKASFYGIRDNFQGKKTASGEAFDTNKLTAAHKSLPFGTNVRVTNTKNNKSVVVRINDRGPYSGDRIIDLSAAAAKAIDMIGDGHANIKAEVLAGATTTQAAAPTTKIPEKNTPDKPTKPLAPSVSPETGGVIAKDAIALSPGLIPSPIPTNNDVQTDTRTGKKPTTPAELFTVSSAKELKFSSDSKFETLSTGTSTLQQSAMQFASTQAALRGDVVISTGNTVKEISAGTAGEPSGVILDYKGNPSVFIGSPILLKRSPLQLQSGYGSVTVQGWNVTEKASVGATLVTPQEPAGNPAATIAVPEWGKLKMSDPIIPGGVYTWGDATKNGTRVPTSKVILANIIAIAQAIQPLTDSTVGKGKKWTITSWYRDPVSNRACGGASRSQHLTGNAIDFNFPGCFGGFWKQMQSSWKGGHAIKSGSFLHLDMGPRRTWRY